MATAAERDLVYLDDDIARLRKRIDLKERAEGDRLVVNREEWLASLAVLRARLGELEKEREALLMEIEA